MTRVELERLAYALLDDNPGATPDRAWGWLSGVVVGVVGMVVWWVVGVG